MTEWTLERIVNQLKCCHYECEGGPLENNEAFMALEEISRIDTSATIRDRDETAKSWRRVAENLEQQSTIMREALELIETGYGCRQIAREALAKVNADA